MSDYFITLKKSYRTLRYRLRWQSCLLGFAVIIFLGLFYSSSLWQLWKYREDSDIADLFQNPYFLHILQFSFYQALLSALLSIILGMLTAHAFFYQSFWGKQALLKLFSLTMVLPVLVAIFGIMGVYGSSGWINQLLRGLGLPPTPSLYGLNGILIAHIFFNLPLAARLFLQRLQAIPTTQHQLAAQLGITQTAFFQLIEWPYLKSQLLPSFCLIFMLCFTSFTVVLTLGGSPKYTTLEVAIFQALTFDFELGKAAIYALVQFIICLLLFQLSSYFNQQTVSHNRQQKHWLRHTPQWLTRCHYAIITLVLLFLLSPLLYILISGLQPSLWLSVFTQRELWKALGYSLLIAPTAGFVCLTMTTALLLGARQFYAQHYQALANSLLNIGMIVLAIPTLVLAVGLFLTLRTWEITTFTLFIIVVLCNALVAMPFAIRVLTPVFYANMASHEKRCQSLGIRGWTRWKLIEWASLRRPMKMAFALATALSLGDFTAIALFGNQHFTSLPRLLYQQLGNYRSQEAAVTALILLILCGFLFLLIEHDKTQPHHDTPQTPTI